MKKFDQKKYMNEWKKENMKQIKFSYKTDFVEEFKNACSTLDIAQSKVIREKMEETIMKANKLMEYVDELKAKYGEAIKELYSHMEIEYDEERFINDLNHEYLTENEGNDSEIYIWYFDEAKDFAINVKTKEIIDSEKTEELFA